MRWRIILFLSVFLLVLAGLNLYVWWRLSSFGFGFKWFYLFLAIAVGSILLGGADRLFANGVAKTLYTLGMVYWGFLFLLFSSLVVTELGRFFLTPQVLTSIAIGLAVFFSIIALFNGQQVIGEEFEIPLDTVQEEVRIVHLSDIHLGSIRGEEWLGKIVAIIKEQRPDFVVITGDLFDGSRIITPETLRPLDELDVPVYVSIGNHEVYDGVQNIAKVLEKTGITLLRNEVVTVAGMQVGAIDHPEQEMRKDNPLAKQLKINKTKPAILLYHPPNGAEDAAAAGFDLQLSGHTHNGQIMPFNLIVKPFYPRINGLYDVEGLKLRTSPGSGTWGPPMRLGSKNVVTLLRVVPG